MLLLVLGSIGLGCTSVRVGGKFGGGDDVIGRTMEVGEGPPVSDWNFTVHTRGEAMGVVNSPIATILCRNGTSLKWNNSYMFVAVESKDIETGFIPEGMNEHGFTVSALTLRLTQYQQPPNFWPAESKQVLCHVELVPYLLGNVRTVAEAKEKVNKLLVIDSVPSTKYIKFHYHMTDVNGNHTILEYIDGKAVWWDEEETGVMTNDPDYGWHLNNLDNYVALSNTLPTYPSGAGGGGDHPSATSFGTNLLGLPGDLSPASRFVRMYFLRSFALSSDGGLVGAANRLNPSLGKRDPMVDNQTAKMLLVQSLLNTVFIVKGSVAKRIQMPMPEMTHWAIMKIPSKRLFYVRTYSNLQWQLIDVSALNPATPATPFHLDEDVLSIANVTDTLQQPKSGKDPRGRRRPRA
eukprot:Hpha_TRINITY_DN15014_c2_g8::TRINITY_DN15014_c2_g8_i1::g.124417::m.124417/K01442/E3.5.1.24; choloylglycine hydrolase